MTDIAALRTAIASYAEEEGREFYLHMSGRKDTLDITSVIRRHGGAMTGDAVREVLDAATATTDPDEARRLRFVAKEVARMVIDRELSPLSDELATTEAAATVEVDGASIGYHAAAVELQNEPDRERRRRLEAARDAVTERHDELRAPIHRLHHQTVRDLGYPGYVDFYAALSDIDLDTLGRQMEEFSARTDQLWTATAGPWFEEAVGVPFTEAERHDAGFLFRMRERDAWFGSEGMVDALRHTLLGLGIALDDQPNVHLDLEDRPGKNPRAFCAPVRVPDEVYLVIRPTGGYQDYRALFHEAGHTEHFAGTAAARPMEERLLGDYSVTEAFAFTLELLLMDREWLEEHTPARGDELSRFVQRAHVYYLYYLRRYAAKIRYELELHRAGPEGLGDMPQRYAALLTAGTGFRFGTAPHLADVDPGFYCANYLRAWMLEAQLRERWLARHGQRWWRPGAAGAALRSLWALGQTYPAHTLASELGMSGLDTRAVERRVTAALAG